MNLQINHQAIREAILLQSQFHGPTTVMRKKVIDVSAKLYRTYFKDNMADSDLAARIVDQFKAVNLPEKLYYYRILKTSLSRKSFTVRFAILDKIIAQLTRQRRVDGADDLMNGKPEQMDEYLDQISNKYKDNPSLIYQQAATYYLYWKMDSEAWKNIIMAFKLKPFHFRNFFLLIFILVMIGRNGILKMVRPHYRTYYNTHN
jgi:hypothetical protein